MRRRWCRHSLHEERQEQRLEVRNWSVQEKRLPLEHGCLPMQLSGKVAACRSRRLGFNPWVRRTPWRRKWQHTPVFLPGKSHGRSRLKDSNRAPSVRRSVRRVQLEPWESSGGSGLSLAALWEVDRTVMGGNRSWMERKGLPADGA